MDIIKFEDFLNERTQSERLLDKAKKEKERAEELFTKGKDKRAERKLEKSKQNLDKAKYINPNIDTKDIEQDVKDIEKIDWEKEFDTTSSLLGKKQKLDNFDIVKKIKVNGDEISPNELKEFLKSVNSYVNEFWNDIPDENDDVDYQSPFNDDVKLKVIHKRNSVVFVYKEGKTTDKVKLIIDKDIFDDKNNKKVLSDEITKLTANERLTGEKDSVLNKNYDSKKDDKKILTPDVVNAPSVETINTIAETPEVKQEAEQIVKDLTILDNGFVQSTIKMLLEENLTTGMSNTNEDRIYKHFVIDNAINTMNTKNIDAILNGYKQKMALKESRIREGFTDIFNSVVDTKSEGLVKDLMNAYNTDANVMTTKINERLDSLAKVYTEAIQNNIKTNESFNIEDAVIGALAMKFLPKIGGGLIGGGAATTAASGTVATAATGTLLGIGPVGWIIIAAIVVGAGTTYWLSSSFKEQETQLATILLMMYASQSPIFLKELQVAGIKINPNKLDKDKLSKLLSEKKLIHLKPFRNI